MGAKTIPSLEIRSRGHARFPKQPGARGTVNKNILTLHEAPFSDACRENIIQMCMYFQKQNLSDRDT
jgi:hypothetical protein